MTWQDLRAGDLTTAAIFAQQTTGAVIPTGVETPGTGTVQLSAARPNPSRGSSDLRLTLPSPTSVRAEVLDVAGRHVATLASGTLPAGVHELSWNGRSDKGGYVAAGVYLVRVHMPGYEKTQRIVRLP
jgi:flagellar hook assembly protein FlgD